VVFCSEVVVPGANVLTAVPLGAIPIPIVSSDWVPE
jgi:hypothetical protein